MKKIILSAVLMAWALSGFGQNYLDVLRPYTGMTGSSGVESGGNPLGGSGSSSLTGNPALLSYADKSFISFDLSYDQVQGSSVFNNSVWDKVEKNGLKFNSLTYIHPVRVYRGAWVWGVNIHPISSYSSISQFSNSDRESDFPITVPADFQYRIHAEETGDLYAYTIGTSFLATMNTSIGFALSILNGHNESNLSYFETDALNNFPDDYSEYLDSLHFAPEYWGIGARVGLSTMLSEVLQLGASIELPTRISVKENSSRFQTEWFDDGHQEIYTNLNRKGLEYAIAGPWRLGIGLGFVNEPLRASINYRFHGYSGISFSGDVVDPDTGDEVAPVIADELKSKVQNVNEFSAALQWALTPITLSFAGSIMNDPLTYHLNNLVRLDTGIGYQFASGLVLTLAYRSEQWQGDLDHTLDDESTRHVEVENTFSKFQFGIKYLF